MRTQSLIQEAEKYLMATYKRFPIAPEKGEGCVITDVDGKKYLDFVAGIAVCNLGHRPPELVEAIQHQAGRLIHTSNLYHIEPQIQLARLLVENSFGDKVFFCNSGAEANEAAIKLARKYAKDQGREDAYRIVCMNESFHGRTLATVSATGQKKFHKGFAPLVTGFDHVPFNNLEAAAGAVTDQTCAVLVEPIQGEGGVNMPSPDYLKGLREMCDQRNILLIFDEVQVGIGRTGLLFAYEHFDVKPHIMTLAKSLAGGFPIGAMIAVDEVAESFSPGTHASTFGGNFLATAAGIVVMKRMLQGELLAHAQDVGVHFREGLNRLKDRHNVIKEVRGLGLILAIELTIPGGGLVSKAMEKGFLINCTADKILRFVPPLVVQKEQVNALLETLDELLAEAE
ncbi:MAG: aspartate aminotransferase family protein [Deltaproteobacteria bacterium]|nr:aspartate aminotransferase family protein [Deltaproteobacteria bacterium]